MKGNGVRDFEPQIEKIREIANENSDLELSIETDYNLLDGDPRNKIHPIRYLAEEISKIKNCDQVLRATFTHQDQRRNERLTELLGYDLQKEIINHYDGALSDSGVKLAVENTFHTYKDVEDFLKMTKEMEYIGLCFDPANLNLRALQPDDFTDTTTEQILDFMDTYKEQIFKFHLKQIDNNVDVSVDVNAKTTISDGQLDMKQLIYKAHELGLTIHLEPIKDSYMLPDPFSKFNTSFEYIHHDLRL